MANISLLYSMKRTKTQNLIRNAPENTVVFFLPLPQIQCVNRFFVHSLLPFQLDVFLFSRLLYGTPGSHARSSVGFCDMEGCGSFPILILCHRQTDSENSNESTFTQPLNIQTLYVVLPVCWTSKVVNECRARYAFQHCCFLLYC